MRRHVPRHAHGMIQRRSTADIIGHVPQRTAHMAHLIMMLRHIHVLHVVHRWAGHVHVAHLIMPGGHVHVVGHHGAHGRHRAVHGPAKVAKISTHVVWMGLRSVVAKGTIYTADRRAI